MIPDLWLFSFHTMLTLAYISYVLYISHFCWQTFPSAQRLEARQQRWWCLAKGSSKPPFAAKTYSGLQDPITFKPRSRFSPVGLTKLVMQQVALFLHIIKQTRALNPSTPGQYAAPCRSNFTISMMGKY